MQIGLIGLGKMGIPMTKRLLSRGHNVVVYDIVADNVTKAIELGAIGAHSVSAYIAKLNTPRINWLMIPAKNVDSALDELVKYLSRGDVIIDGGNSFFKDSIARAKMLNESGISFLDIGTSGGINIGEGEACFMVGGDEVSYKIIEPILRDLAVEKGYALVGSVGAGHLVKGYHNLVEYGMMQAIAEGGDAMSAVATTNNLVIDLQNVFTLWNHGSINQGRLIECAAQALKTYPNLTSIEGRVMGETYDEMKALAELAEAHGVRVPAARTAMQVRKDSQVRQTYTTKLLGAMRNIFGGHSIK